MATEVSPGITVDPSIAAGKPVIAGTRTPVVVVLDELAAGASIAEVCREYDLTEAQVRAVLAYAASHS